MLIDTSAWITFYTKPKSAIALFIDKHLDTALPVHTCPVVLQEILQGTREDKAFRKIARIMQTYKMLTLADQIQAAIDASHIYRNCRKKGITIRKSNDCVIAHIALAFDIELLHQDKDFDNIAKVYPLKIVKI